MHPPSHHAASRGDSPEDIAQDIAAVARIDAIPMLLRVLCDTTGMGYAAVARVTDTTWTACAVQDNIGFGLGVGSQLDLDTTLCRDVMVSGEPIIIDHASTDARYCDHHTPRIYRIESYVSVPINTEAGYFGNLCAVDPAPNSVSEPRIASMVVLFAQLIGMHLDNDRKREAVHAALLDERAAGELREQFIAILGHDLRNPLAAVGACGRLLQKTSDDPTVLDIAGRIDTNVRRMSGLIDDVLDLARGRLGGDIGVHLEPVADLGPALCAVARELQDAHPQRCIDVRIALDGATVHCDRGRIQQLASNLLGNALTHGAQDGTVRFTATADGNDWVLEVWNDGEPIPSESVGKVFAPFWRRSISAKRDGLGLGLHICAQIVKSHGGRISVNSTAEDGTTFTARMPLVPAAAG
jgi:signal transduction histidine kinase